MISVIIPCYNQAKFLADALKGLQSQTYSDWECVIVDDGSTDASADIARTFAASDSRIKLFSKENGGTATARNMGLRNIHGDYVRFLDADDDLNKETLARQVEYMEKNGLDISATEWCYFIEKENHEIEYIKHSPMLSKVLFSFRFSLLTRWGLDFSIAQHALMYRVEFLKKNQLFFDEKIRYREDWDFLINASACHPIRVGFLHELEGAYYRKNPDGKTGSATKMSRGNFIYLQYKCSKVGLLDFLCLSYRLSCELFLLLGRVVKLRNVSILSDLSILFGHWKAIMMFVICLLFLPLAIVHVVIRSIIEYK